MKTFKSFITEAEFPHFVEGDASYYPNKGELTIQDPETYAFTTIRLTRAQKDVLDHFFFEKPYPKKKDYPKGIYYSPSG